MSVPRTDRVAANEVAASSGGEVVYTSGLGIYLVSRDYCDLTGANTYSVRPSVLARTTNLREGIEDETEAVRMAQGFEDAEIDSEAARDGMGAVARHPDRKS